MKIAYQNIDYTIASNVEMVIDELIAESEDDTRRRYLEDIRDYIIGVNEEVKWYEERDES